jgi:hydrogenase maturation protease
MMNLISILLFRHENDDDLLSSVNRTVDSGRGALICSENAVKRTALSISDWQTELTRLLQSSSEDKIVLIGVGHPLRGDDYVGSHIVKELIKCVEPKPVNVDFVDAEDSVESVITKVAEASPKCVIFIDSCEMNAEPGETHLISISETNYPFFTTHGIPLKLLAERLLRNSQAWVLAIQPKQIEFSEKMCPEVLEAGALISEFVMKRLLEVS